MRFVQTCSACPEQYDVFDGPKMVGYLRLRWGQFSAYYLPNGVLDFNQKKENAPVLAYHHAYKDDFMGSFPSEEERARQLKRALAAIKAERRARHRD